MAKFIGKNTRVKVGTVDLTQSIAAVTINQTVDEIETTALGQAARSRIGGLEDASVTHKTSRRRSTPSSSRSSLTLPSPRAPQPPGHRSTPSRCCARSRIS